jgi:hypothetical protein
MTVTAANLVDDESFRAAWSIDADVPASPGVYAVRLLRESTLPEPFGALLNERSSRLIYVGKATSLESRMLRNELRGRGHGTFFRSIGAVLGFRPEVGSLAKKANKNNFSFEKGDRDAIVEWINANLEVSWLSLPAFDVPVAESALILEHRPLLNLQNNPLALSSLIELRRSCRLLASLPVL